MPKNIYPGKKMYEKDKYFETKISFDKIYNDPKINNIKHNGTVTMDSKVPPMIPHASALIHNP